MGLICYLKSDDARICIFLTLLYSYFFFSLFAERVGAEVVECACVIELPELKVLFAYIFQCDNFLIFSQRKALFIYHVGIV